MGTNLQVCPPSPALPTPGCHHFDLKSIDAVAANRINRGSASDPVSLLRALAQALRHSASGMPLGVVLAGPGLEEQFLDRVAAVQIGDFTVPVISPEDLVVTKVLAGREKDVGDIRGVLHARAEAELAPAATRRQSE